MGYSPRVEGRTRRACYATAQRIDMFQMGQE